MKKSISIFLFLMIFNTMVFANQFEDPYLCKIQDTHGSAHPPDRFFNYFRSLVSCKLDNGLELFYSENWLYETQAIDDAEWIKRRYKNESGYIVAKGSNRGSKKVFSGSFAFRLKDSVYSEKVNVYLRNDFNFNICPTIISVIESEHEEIQVGWFSTTKVYKYDYIIELSNGKKWITPPQEPKWENKWKEGDKIVLIGESSLPCLVNINIIKGQDRSCLSLDPYPSIPGCLMVSEYETEL